MLFPRVHEPNPIPVCRGCGCKSCLRLGDLPDSREFAGIALPEAIPGGALFRCTACALVFRFPILATGQYNQLYAQASTTVWSAASGTLRMDQNLVKSYLQERWPQGARVLDIGCYTGDFLSALPARYQKFGVEQCQPAARQCERRGITILADDLYQLGALDEKFDVVTAMDVIEHTSNPRDFMSSVLSLLTDDGIALITTGDADNKIWRRVKGAFWYCANAEHISFISTRWLKASARMNHFRVSHIKRFRYMRRSPVMTVVKRMVIYARSTLGMTSKPSWTAHISADHLFAAVRR
jgi:2-polyprenyl-3-methyl-5-hydroxy-6-metoxy-1,4-benzoquinol methylase